MMYFRYFLHLLIYDVILRLLNFIVYPIAYTFRKQARKYKLLFPLWIFLHDSNEYGHKTFLDVHGYPNGRFFHDLKISYIWSLRNPLHNLYYKYTIKGEKTHYKGYETCQIEGHNKEWRTLRTKDKNNNPNYKHGKYIDYNKAILGKQFLKFKIGKRKYFKKSLCWAYNIRVLKLFIILEYKFGFEGVNWAIQFSPHIRKADKKAIKEWNEFKNSVKMITYKY